MQTIDYRPHWNLIGTAVQDVGEAFPRSCPALSMKHSSEKSMHVYWELNVLQL